MAATHTSQTQTVRVDAGAGEARPADAATSLEQFQSVVTQDGRAYEFVPCGCDCWYCPHCATRKGYNLRAELIPVLRSFTGIMMVTLTIDPQLFESPQVAYMHVRERRGISRLVRELARAGHLHTRRYFSVLEFQRDTEQAHFHVLLDATRVPKATVDAAWSRLRPAEAPPREINRPAFGMTRFSKPRFDGGAKHAARYATKYLVKTPEHGYPEWVMALGTDVRVPRYSVSKGFWARQPKPTRESASKREPSCLTYRQRIEHCGETTNVLERDGDDSTGVRAPRRWKGRIGLSRAMLSGIAEVLHASDGRLTLHGDSARSAVRSLSEAAGLPIRVVSGCAS